MTEHQQGPYRSATLEAPSSPRAPRGVRWVAAFVASALVCGGLRGALVQRRKVHVAVQQRAALIGATAAPRVSLEPLRDATEFVAPHPCVRTRGGATYCWSTWAALGVSERAPGATFAVAQVVTEPLKWVAWKARDPAARAEDVYDGQVCALTRRGEVWCRCDTPGGGSQIERINRLGAAVSVAATQTRRCAVTAEGAVMCWGSASRAPEVTLRLDEPIARAAMNIDSLCVLDRSRRVRCMALGELGRLHAGGVHAPSNSEPAPVSPLVSERVELRGARAIAAFWTETCAITARAEVHCWGAMHRHLGRGTLVSDPRPAAVEGLTDVASIALGDHHGCALTGSGRVRCWGSNLFGERGDEASRTEREAQPPIEGLTEVAQIEAHSATTCARTARGEVWCWGLPTREVDGRIVEEAQPRPRRVALPFVAAEVAMHDRGVCARSAAGEVWCWGAAYGPDAHVIPGIAAAQQIVAARDGVCALDREGAVDCWRTVERFGRWHPEPPVRVACGRARSLSIGANARMLCATRLDGRVECLTRPQPSSPWGRWDDLWRRTPGGLDGLSQLTPYTSTLVYGVDRGGTLITTLPVPERGLRGVVALRTSNDFACAAHQDGTVSCWGVNEYGALGRGGTHPDASGAVRVFSQVQQ